MKTCKSNEISRASKRYTKSQNVSRDNALLVFARATSVFFSAVVISTRLSALSIINASLRTKSAEAAKSRDCKNAQKYAKK